MQSKQKGNTYCGLLQLSACYCYITCYKTSDLDDCGRSIYALDALCIKKENISVVGAVYCLFFSNPIKYIQHEFISEDTYNEKAINNYAVDLSSIFENYYAVCLENVNARAFEEVEFQPSFRGFDASVKEYLVSHQNTPALYQPTTQLSSDNTPGVCEKRKNESTISREAVENDSLSQLHKSHDNISCQQRKCNLWISIVEERRFIFGKIRKFIIKGTFDNDYDLLHIEKYYTDKSALDGCLNKLLESLKERGFEVVVNRDFSVKSIYLR